MGKNSAVDAATIEKEALLLTEGERVILADRLLEGLTPISPELQRAWIEEADSRMKAFHDGRIVAVDGPDAMAKLRARSGR